MVRLDWRRGLAVFKPGDRFAYERWEGNKYGTRSWSIFVLESAAPDQRFSRVPGLNPGALKLLSLHDKASCLRFLNALDRIKHFGNPEQVSSQDWCLIGNRLIVDLDPAPVIDRAMERTS